MLDPAAGSALGELQVAALPVDTRSARMDLAFSLGERFAEGGEPAGIGGAVEFRADLFDAASIETLIERLARVLEAMTADPGRRLSAVDVLDAVERVGWTSWCNRAVLNERRCRCRSVSIAGVVRGAGGRGRRMRWRWCSGACR